MDEQYIVIARRVAIRLEEEYDLNLQDALDQYIVSTGTIQDPSYNELTDNFTRTVAILSLLLQAASFGWTVREGMQPDSSPPVIEQKLEREIRDECIKDDSFIPLDQQDYIFRLVAEEASKSDL
ncbi:MAG: hypothetical protein AAGM29_16680 [Cyanobacteria bacterium J06588_4]